MQTVNQKNYNPTRKVWAVILSSMIIAALNTTLTIVWEDHPFTPYMDHLDQWLQAILVSGIAYQVKEWLSNVKTPE
jgi:hypothetical protein